MFVIGIFIGKNWSSENNSQRQFIPYNTYESSNDDIRDRLEEARSKASDAYDAAEEAADNARMRYYHTGRHEDLMKMYDAEDAADQAEDALSSVDDALSEVD